MSYQIQVLSVKLQRSDNTVSWGFNVQGGKEFHSPLVIQKVNANSLAERSSIRQGDYILRIGNIIAENLTHNQARDAIIRQGNSLELTLQRGSPPRSEDYAVKYDFPHHQLMQGGVHHHAPPAHHYSGSGFESTATLSPQVGLQMGSNKALLTQSYNSPMGLYSSQNIADTLATTVKNETNKPNNLYVCTSLSSSSSTGSLTATSSSVSPISFNNTTSQNDSNKNFDLNSKAKPFLINKPTTNDSLTNPIQIKLHDDNNNRIVNLNNYNNNSNDCLTNNSSSLTSSLSTSPSFISNIRTNNTSDENEIDNSSKFLYRAIPFEIKQQQESENQLKPSSSFFKYSSANENEENLKNELKTQLNLIKVNSINKLDDNERSANVNNTLNRQANPGLLLLKSIEKNIISENDFAEENKKSFKKNYSDSTLKIDIPSSITASKLTQPPKPSSTQISQLSYLKKSQYQYPVKKPSSIGSNNHIRHHVIGHVSKLDDPTKPSVTQSRSFKLLQEMLDNGLVEQNAVYHDNITNKNQMRRCSLNLRNNYFENANKIDDNLVRTSKEFESIDGKLNDLKLDQEGNENKLTTNNTNIVLSANTNKFLIDYPKPFINKNDSLIKDKNNNNNYNEKFDSNRNNESLKSSLYNPSGASSISYQPYQQPPHQPHHYQPPPPPVHRPVAPFNSAPPAPSGQQPFRNSNLSTSLAGNSQAGGQRSFTRGTKGSALLTNPNASAAVPTCAACYQLIRGPFISAVGKIWCPGHFVCAHPACGTSLIDVGFVEENGKLYCESDFEKYFAPQCYKCQKTILGECCYALEKAFHPECFVCGHCKQAIGSGSFHLEDGKPYCIRDFNALFSTKCAGCEFPIEAGDKFVEAFNQKYHVECFTCAKCNVPLNGGYATKGNKPYCRKHAY